MKPIPTWRETHADDLGPDGGICDSQICLKWAEQEIDALRDENAQLKAELAGLRDQKPVAYGWLIHEGVYDTICPEEHARHEGKYTTPLYAAPGAK